LVLPIVWNLVLLVEEFHRSKLVVGGGLFAQNLFVCGLPVVCPQSPSNMLLADLKATIDMSHFPEGTNKGWKHEIIRMCVRCIITVASSSS
jgi:hypothetical protein